MIAVGWLESFRFETPGYLVLLGLLPLLAAFSARSLAGLGPIRRWIAIVMRCLVSASLICALAGMQTIRETDDLAVVFLLDRSRSVPREQQTQAFQDLAQAQRGKRELKDRFGVIAFDGAASVEQLVMGDLAIKQVGEPIDPDQTNISTALRMALALFTDEAARRLVVFSDGNENVGSALEEADRFAAAGVPIDVRPLRYRHENEVVFERLSAPATAKAEETINLQLLLRSQSQDAVSGKILLYHNDQLVDLDPEAAGAGYAVVLEPGPNRLTVPVPLRAAGAHRFRAIFQPDRSEDDVIPGNNEGRAFTVVSGQGRILILTSASEEDQRGNLQSARLLAEALERERLACDVEIAGAAPLDQVRLLEYSAVILSNVSADKFTSEERQGLAVFVRDLGGGLVMLGGEESFGAGGWMDTPVEEVMPVSFDVKSKRQIPKGALVLVMHACEIPQGNYWGERVAIAAVKTLSSRDLVGVLSYKWQGASQQYWDVKLQPVGDKGRIIQHIKQMNMGDMPDFDAVMRPGVNELKSLGDDVSVRHMIVISDFDPSAPRPDLLRTMKDNFITCSTIAIGWGGHPIDVGKAQSMAADTGGRFYTTQNYAELPQIFIKESRIVQRSLINELPFTPRLAGLPSTTVSQLVGETLPELRGYVVTTPKPLAQIPIVKKTAEEEDPILAHWQVGLGKTVAFTSGLWTRWGQQWANWPKFSPFWGQLVRWCSRQAATAAFDVSTSTQGGRGRIRVEALDRNAAAINFMNIVGTLVRPDHESESLQLTQTGPGVYEGEFGARQTGSYIASFSYRLGAGGDAVSGTFQTGLSVAFSPEYRELETNEALLAEIASRTGGRVLGDADLASIFAPSRMQPVQIRRPAWEYLIRWMLLLFLLDVGVRRIAVNPLELALKIRQFIAEMGGLRQPAEASATVLTTLRGTQAQRREEERSLPAESGSTPDRSTRYESRTMDARASEQLARALDGASEMDRPVVARPTKKAASTGEADFTARLLAAKKRAQERLKDAEDQGKDPESSP